MSTSGLEACQQYWPHLFGSLDGGERQRILASLRAVRPRLIKGYEVLAMARLLLEDKRRVPACDSAKNESGCVTHL